MNLKIEVINADCFEYMKTLPDKSFDLIITDPPYGVDYQGGHFHSGNVKIRRTRERLSGDKQEARDIYAKLFFEAYRLLKDNSGGAYVFYADSVSEYVYQPTPFTKYQMLIWGKSNARYAAMNARYKHNFEPFIWLQKPPTKWRGSSKETALWWMKGEAENYFHPTQKPIDVIKKMILNSSDVGDTIFDPFMGSGTTLVAAKELGRNAIGIEISKDYCEKARRRINNAQTSMFL